MRSLKEMVNNNQRVTFQYYRDGDLWYTTECGFKFPVPISDIGNATFNASDKAILFMRYIRKFMEKCAQENDGGANGRISSNAPNMTSIRNSNYLRKPELILEDTLPLENYFEVSNQIRASIDNGYESQ